MYVNRNKKRSKQKYIYYNKSKISASNYEGSIDLQSIAEWIACGFFLGNKNFTKSEFEEEINQNHNKRWYFEPIEISFSSAVEKFTHIFETIILKKIKNRQIILPLSGGLDSRTIASALRNTDNIVSYSYEFFGGIKVPVDPEFDHY